MVLDPNLPLDSELLSALPKFIRETRAAINTEKEDFITSIPVEYGTENYDVMFLDETSNMFRRAKAGDDTRHKAHGVYLLDYNAVKISGHVSNDAWSFVPGMTVYVSDKEYGDVTGDPTGLVCGIALSVDTMIVSSTLSEQVGIIMEELSDARLGFITLGQTMRDLSGDIVSLSNEVVAARAGSIDLSGRLIDILAAELTENGKILDKVVALESAMSNAIRTYPTLLALMEAHEAQYRASSLELSAARGTNLTLADRLSSIVSLFDEVIAARSGKLDLLARLTEIVAIGTPYHDEITQARGSFNYLKDRLTAIETADEIVDLSLQNTIGEIVQSRGLAATLNARLNVSLNLDGSLKTTISPVVWFPEAGVMAKLTNTSYTVDEDKTAIYVPGRAIELNGAVYCYVSSSSFSAGTGKTTIYLTGAGSADVLSSFSYSFHPNVLPQISHNALGSVLGADSTSSDAAKIKHVSDLQIKNLADQGAASAASVSTLQGQMTTAIADINTAEGTLVDHTTRLGTAETTLTSHGTRLTTAEGDINAIEGDVAALEATMLVEQEITANSILPRVDLMTAKTSSFTAASKNVYRVQTAGITITPPVGPALGDWFSILPEVDLAASPVTFNTVSQKFQGLSEALLIDTNNMMTFIYTGATYGWTVGN